MISAALTDWLQAIGGVGAFVTTVILAVLAGRQMSLIRDQAEATKDQATAALDQLELDRAAARASDSRRAREEELRIFGDQEARARHQQQLDALVAQAEATREATQAQLMPLVYAHRRMGPRFGPQEPDQNGQYGLGHDEVEFHYYLSNEGLGPALNIEHGVEVRGRVYLFGNGEAGYLFRTCRPGEFLPPLSQGSKQPVPSQTIPLVTSKAEFYAGRTAPASPELYICRYEDLFGRRWETRNSPDATQPPEVRELQAGRGPTIADEGEPRARSSSSAAPATMGSTRRPT